MAEKLSEPTTLIGSILDLFQIQTNIDPSLLAAIDASLITVIVTLTASAIISPIAYYLKRNFLNKDFVNRQNIEHSVWLLKQLHKVAVTHYAFLTRNLINAESEIKRADLVCDSRLIENAYAKTSQLLIQYDKFLKDTGANILFIERTNENKVIGKICSLFITLPFDHDDHLRIIKNEHELPQESFTNWINSKKCSQSKKLVKERLSELRHLFDDETEKILHYDYFLKSRKMRRIKHFKTKLKKFMQPNVRNSFNRFFICEIFPKYVKNGENVWLFGKGFEDDSITYSFIIDNNVIPHSVKCNELIELTLPKSICKGAYDITTKFEINKKTGHEPTGIVIHIVDQTYLDKKIPHRNTIA